MLNVSKQISQLEKGVGITLIKRSKRRLKLTKQCEELLNVCKNAFNQIEDFLIELIAKRQSPCGDLKTNCVGGYVGEKIVTNICHAFQKRYPQINIKLEFSRKRIDLINSEFDHVL